MKQEDLEQWATKWAEDKSDEIDLDDLTILSMLGKTYNENSISDFLAFLLNPNNKPNEENRLEPLNALLGVVFKNKTNKLTITADKKVEVYREYSINKKRLDILICVKSENCDVVDYYIVIENKIYSSEGENQTQNYYDFINNMECKNSNNNVFIFLTPTGIEASSDKFVSVSYDDLFDCFCKIQFKNKKIYNYYMTDFCNHIKKYILEENFSENEIAFIQGCNDQDCNEEKIEFICTNKKKYESLYKKACVLRDRYLKMIIKAIEKRLSNDWIVKQGPFYIQIYKSQWHENGFDIHYEIITNPKNKGILFDGCKFLIMLHAERVNRIPKNDFRSIFEFKEEKSNFNKTYNVIYEQSLPVSFSDKKSAEESIKEIVKKLLGMMKENYIEQIDDILKSK